MNMLTNFFVAVLISIIAGLILSYPAMLLWNSCFVPAVTFAKEIGWLQAWGIMIMVGLMTAKTSTKIED
jgi:hypothetical protein